MNYIKKICSFTGYRTAKLNISMKNSRYGPNDLKTVISCEINKLINDGFEVFQCGMALGSDTIFAELILEFKQRYPTVSLSAFIPCREQDKAWDKASKDEYKRILSLADEVRLINDAPYFDGCMQERNVALVDTCDVLLAVYDGLNGGTKNTIEYAKTKNVKTIIISPKDFMKITLY